MLKKFTLLILVAAFLGCAGGGSVYDASMEMEKQVALMAEQYDVWYQAANEVTKAKLRKEIDPLFMQAGRLLDDWQTALALGGEGEDFEEQLKILKSQIILELALILQEED
jgi:hypothetical protein